MGKATYRITFRIPMIKLFAAEHPQFNIFLRCERLTALGMLAAVGWRKGKNEARTSGSQEHCSEPARTHITGTAM